MEFRKYQHLERFGTTEVQNIELGKCYVFPKIDGTNASVWLDENGDLCAGSRRRKLSLEEDNGGFFEWVSGQANVQAYLGENPSHRLFGEWLIPHSLKTYKENAWKNFYVFDVCIDKHESELLHDGDDQMIYLPYESYKVGLDEYNINYIPPIKIINNGTYESMINQLATNVFLIEDGKGSGEGIVLKNYEFKNKYNRQTWAKIITSEFKEKHSKEMGAPEINGPDLVEEKIVEKYVSKALCEKVYAKIENESGFRSKDIPRLLNTVYYDLVKEESWNFIKENRNPTIDYKRLHHFTINKVKSNMSHLF